METGKERLNTTHATYSASDDVNSLTGPYDLLFDRNDGFERLIDDCEGHVWYLDRLYDLFEDSDSVAAHYQEGDLFPVLEHNLTDVHRTW